jgi:hypothetical protein
MSGHWSHWVWAGIGAAVVFPLKMLWDWYLSKFWTAFLLSFKAGFKQTPAGQTFFKAFYESRAKKDAQIAEKHPELEKMLRCKECGGKGCEACGGTGWA